MNFVHSMTKIIHKITQIIKMITEMAEQIPGTRYRCNQSFIAVIMPSVAR
jgi:hypothetical protein